MEGKNESTSNTGTNPNPSPRPISFTANLNVHDATVSPDDDHLTAIIAGTSNRSLAEKVCQQLGRKLTPIDINKFSDGEIIVQIKETMRGKDVFIIQTCTSPVNDSIMELLLMVGAANRSGASSVTAVIPYFGYRLNRRGLPISSTHHSRFLWNAANDISKMLMVIGVDKVISVDLQRPGQSHEACFTKTSLPAETISTNDLFIEYFANIFSKASSGAGNNNSVPIAVVSANMELGKKAKKFQNKLRVLLPNMQIDYGVFVRSGSDHNMVKDPASLEFQGSVKGKDVLVIEDYLDSAVPISLLIRRLVKEGARKVYLCAPHGSFDSNAIQLIDLLPITQVVVSDSIPLPSKSSSKIVQLSIAPLIAKVIQSDITYCTSSEFNSDDEGDQMVPE